MLDGAALAGLGLAAAARSAAAPAEGSKIEPLPTFKFNIENQKGWQGEGGSAKEATVEEFPISTSIAGVSMRLKPGAIRELHWHSLAAEWAYVIDGRCRTTVISPNGQSEIDDFGPGDTWYFPRGHGHALQGLGPGECHFLLGFDNGHFSEYGTFSITDWVATAPPHIVSRVLGVPPEALAQFPKKELYIGTGKVPSDGDRAAAGRRAAAVAVFAQIPAGYASRRCVFPGGIEYRVTSKEFPMQTSLTAVKMMLQPGALRELHWHPHADEWQYFVRGRARVGVFGSHGRTRTEEFGQGDVGFVTQGHGHYIEQIGDQPTEILILFNSGEYQEISLANWLGGNPASLLMDNFTATKEVVDRLPRKETGIFKKG